MLLHRLFPTANARSVLCFVNNLAAGEEEAVPAPLQKDTKTWQRRGEEAKKWTFPFWEELRFNTSYMRDSMAMDLTFHLDAYSQRPLLVLGAHLLCTPSIVTTLSLTTVYDQESVGSAPNPVLRS